MSDNAELAEFLHALASAVSALGGRVVAATETVPGDQPVHWHGEIVAWVRPADLRSALVRMIGDVERDVGATLADMDRAGKQVAVRLLDERGAFVLRGAVDDVASRMGVSRVTLYAYLNALSDR